MMALKLNIARRSKFGHRGFEVDCCENSIERSGKRIDQKTNVMGYNMTKTKERLVRLN
jgi:hypothetical protein